MLILNIVNVAFSFIYYNSFVFINNPLWLKYLIFYNISWLLIVFINPPFNVLADRKLKLAPLLRSVLINIVIHGSIILGSINFISWSNYKSYIFIYSSFTLFLILSRILILLGLKWYRKRGYNYRNVILIEANSSNSSLKKYLENHTELGYRLKKVFSNDLLNSFDKNRSNLKNYITLNEVDEVFINPNDLSVDVLTDLINFIEDQFVKVRILSDLGLNLNRNMTADNYGQFWFLDISPLPLDRLKNRVAKRLIDILFSILIITIIISWVFPIVSLLIFIETGRPVIFKQLRSGEKNKSFHCLKFRTMTINKEADSIQSNKNDSRITKIGRFLRGSSIDELPQFFNVLKGDMSVVGPRPHMLKHTEDYSKIVKRYLQRHHVKPGITGLAQIKGFRGEITNIQDIKGRVDLDKFYIENWSLYLDTRIIFTTAFQIFKPIKKVY